MEVLSFFIGIAFFYTHLWEAIFILLLACYLYQSLQYLCWFGIGILWALIHQYSIQSQGMPFVPSVGRVNLEGIVSSIPKINHDKSQFQFDVQRFQGKEASTRVFMNCYQACPKVKVGEAWRLQVTLRKNKSNQLPGELNRQYWMMSNHIEWFGVIHPGHAVRLALPQGTWRFQAFRAYLAETLAYVLKTDPTLGLVQGLTLGVASNIDKAQWDLFRRTGTTHLVVISGEHIGLIAGCVWMMVRFLWGRGRHFALYMPAQQVASCAAWSVGCFYAFLVGLGAPTERAIIGFGILVLRYFLPQRFTAWQAWRYALFIILCLEPHVVVTPGFYLSFLAVVILMLTSARFQAKKLKQMFQLQLACLLGLLPVTLYAFSYASLNGFLVNLIAIPLVGFVIVPASLLGLLLIQIYPWSGWLFVAKVASLLFLKILSLIDCIEWINLHFQVEHLYGLISILLGFGLFFLMPIQALFPLYLMLTILPFFPQHLLLREHEAKVTIFDVGQGLSVLVQTARHFLLYDTGGVFYKGGDWASFKVMPYLNYLHANKIDALVISHQDMDHRGGLPSIEQAYQVSTFLVNDPAFYHRGISCHAYQNWEWDGVSFRFFPLPTAFEKRNNTSCILQIRTKYGRLLLTGDIEEKAERFLTTHYARELASDYLVVPHHGSRTSSSATFLRVVNPHLAIISSGLNNRYHFPHQETLNTYHQLHIPLENTAILGAIQIDLKPKV